MTAPNSEPANGASGGWGLIFSSRWTDARRLALIALGYAFSVKLALIFPDAESVLASVWPPSGLALAALLLSPRRQRWPILTTIFFTGMVVDLASGRDALASLGFMVADVLEPLACAWLLNQWCGNTITFTRIREVLTLFFCATALNGLTAVVGSAAAILRSSAQFYDFYATWWIGDGLGILLVTPLIIAGAGPWRRYTGSWQRLLEVVMLSLIWGACAWLGFLGDTAGLPVKPEPYWIFAPLVWAALRLGTRGTTVLLAGLAVISIWLTAAGWGDFPLGGHNPLEHLHMVQIFIGVATLTGLALAAVVSERKQTEDALRVSEQTLQEAQATANMGSFVHDLVSNRVTSSPQLEKILGIDPDRGRSTDAWRECLHPDDREAVLAVAKACYEHGTPFDIDYRIVRRSDGQMRWLRGLGRSERDGRGQIVRLIGVNIDITSRKETDNALVAEKEQLAVTLRSIGDGVITTDTEGRIVLVNSVAEILTGWSQGEAQGRPLTEVFTIINEKTRQPCENPVEKVLLSGESIGLTNHTVLVARDGRERNIADSGAPIRDRENRTVGVVLVFRDVTAQLYMEQEQLKIKKLESVGILAGGIAHDFNNILTAVLGNLNLVQQSNQLDERSQTLLHAAEMASLRARDLTQQLLTFSKGGEPIRKTAAIGEIIRESANFVLHGGVVACRYLIPEDLWLVDIDKGQMSQVIQNIILNAKHAMPQGGEIVVRCENVGGPAATTGGLLSDTKRAVRISISDTGTGIPTDKLDKIFDPYFTTKEKGSGLGLAITHSIISKHNGQISVQSSLGKGTTFTILLPVSFENQSEKDDVEVVATVAGGNARVMIMDDEEVIRTVVNAMLTHLGYEVVEAREGKEALALYQAYRDEGRPIDLVIMDLTIPGGMGGKEAIQELLALDPAAKVIVSSGYSNDPVMANCRQYGFLAAAAKPFEMQDIVRAIQQVESHARFHTDAKGDE